MDQQQDDRRFWAVALGARIFLALGVICCTLGAGPFFGTWFLAAAFRMAVILSGLYCQFALWRELE